MIARLLLIALAVWISGCASRKDAVLPQDGPSMLTVYREHFARLRRQTDADGARDGAPRPLATGPADLAGYTRDVADAIEARFPRLANPTLVMYVFPHLSPDGYPVPGYATQFPLYERVEYALPGEPTER